MSRHAASLGVQTRKLIKDVAGGEHCLERLEGRRSKAERTQRRGMEGNCLIVNCLGGKRATKKGETLNIFCLDLV